MKKKLNNAGKNYHFGSSFWHDVGQEIVAI